MAIFRKIQTTYWSDSFISELEADKKLFYIYLLTNERTTQCGIYEITKRQISFDLGYSMEAVTELLKFFVEQNKIRYSAETNEILLFNWVKYNDNTSPKVKSLVNKELTLIKNKDLIQYRYSIDTVSILNPQEEEEQEEELEQEREREEEKKNSPTPDFSKKEIEIKEAFITISNDNDWIGIISKTHKINPNKTLDFLEEFMNDLRCRDIKQKSIADTKAHFASWLNKKFET